MKEKVLVTMFQYFEAAKKHFFSWNMQLKRTNTHSSGPKEGFAFTSFIVFEFFMAILF